MDSYKVLHQHSPTGIQKNHEYSQTCRENDHASFVGRWSWNVLIQPSAGDCGQFQRTMHAFARTDRGKVRIFRTCEFPTTTVLPTVTATSALHSLWDLNIFSHKNCFHSMHSAKAPSNATARKAWSYTSTPAYTFITRTGTSQPLYQGQSTLSSNKSYRMPHP